MKSILDGNHKNQDSWLDVSTPSESWSMIFPIWGQYDEYSMLKGFPNFSIESFWNYWEENTCGGQLWAMGVWACIRSLVSDEQFGSLEDRLGGTRNERISRGKYWYVMANVVGIHRKCTRGTQKKRWSLGEFLVNIHFQELQFSWRCEKTRSGWFQWTCNLGLHLNLYIIYNSKFQCCWKTVSLEMLGVKFCALEQYGMFEHWGVCECKTNLLWVCNALLASTEKLIAVTGVVVTISGSEVSSQCNGLLNCDDVSGLLPGRDYLTIDMLLSITLGTFTQRYWVVWKWGAENSKLSVPRANWWSKWKMLVWSKES